MYKTENIEVVQESQVTLEELCEYEGVTECQVAFDRCKGGSKIYCLVLIGSCTVSELQIGSEQLDELLNSNIKCTHESDL